MLKCQQCSYKTWNKSQLEHHSKTIHKKIKLYYCELCNKTFLSKLKLKRHKNSVHENVTVMTHQKAVHGKVKHLICFKCDCSFLKVKKLFEHIKAVHPLKNKTVKAYQKKAQKYVPKLTTYYANKDPKQLLLTHEHTRVA